MSSEWATLSKELAETTAKASAHAVAVHTESRGSSSGVVWRPGIIVTAEHTLQRDEDIQLTLPDGRVTDAKLVGRDPSSDVAVLKCEQASTAVPSFSDTTTLHAGNVTLVVGHTRASGPTAALAFVSMVANERRLWGGLSLSPYVRLDVALQRTGVGGAVVDAEGRVAGIATPKFAPTEPSPCPSPRSTASWTRSSRRAAFAAATSASGCNRFGCRRISERRFSAGKKPPPWFWKSNLAAQLTMPAW
jgi:S1-C subfamily serine protease